MHDLDDDLNLGVLQNIEFAIISVYRQEPSLLDADAEDAVKTLARHYHAEEEGRTPPVRNLANRAEAVFQGGRRSASGAWAARGFRLRKRL